jgi:hypothetical protein
MTNFWSFQSPFFLIHRMIRAIGGWNILMRWHTSAYHLPHITQPRKRVPGNNDLKHDYEVGVVVFKVGSAASNCI